MTRDEILAMEPGRELDALVAEKVIGLRICLVDQYQIPCPDNKIGCLTLHTRAIKQYSTDISAAWEVVEKFPLMQIEYVEIFEGNKSVNVNTWASGDDVTGEPFRATAKTAPEAICKAALLAIMT